MAYFRALVLGFMRPVIRLIPALRLMLRITDRAGEMAYFLDWEPPKIGAAPLGFPGRQPLSLKIFWCTKIAAVDGWKRGRFCCRFQMQSPSDEKVSIKLQHENLLHFYFYFYFYFPPLKMFLMSSFEFSAVTPRFVALKCCSKQGARMIKTS